MDAGDTVWWDSGGTWNPVGGCKPVSTECANCYAAIQAGTLHQSAGTKREVRLLYDGVVDKRGERYWFNGKPTELPRGHSSWNFPLDWPGADHPLLGDGQPSLIFACDMTDLFYHERRLIDRVVGILGLSRHIGQLLTKRADVMAEYFIAPRPPSRLRTCRRSCGSASRPETSAGLICAGRICAHSRTRTGRSSSPSRRCWGR